MESTAPDISGMSPQQLTEKFVHLAPHNRALGMTLEALRPRFGTLRLPYRDFLVGDPETGVLHGGVITTLIDSISGLVAVMSQPKIIGMATLDLRIDYLKPATPKRDLFADAHCYKLTPNFAFVRCMAYHDTPDDAVALGMGIFIVTHTDPVVALEGVAP